MAMWSMPPKLKDLFSGFEKYGHSGTRWINPRHNVLIDDMDFDMHNGIRCLKGQQMVAEGSSIAMYENIFFPGLSDMVTGGTVKIRYPNGSDGECRSYHLTTLQGPMPLKSDKKQESTMVTGAPQALIHGPKLCKAKGCHQFSGRTCRSQTARSGHQNWGPEPKDCSHGKCHWPGLSWYELPHGLPVECVNWWPSGLVGWATSACGDCHLNLSDVSLCWLFQMFLSSGLLVSPWVNGYIFGCPLPIPGTCCCQLVSGVLGLANASLVCAISGRCPTASPATVGGALYAASCGYFL